MAPHPHLTSPPPPVLWASDTFTNGGVGGFWGGVTDAYAASSIGSMGQMSGADD